jgi:tryptophan synthase alpha chain
VGFGVRTAEQAQAIGASADGVVVGSAIVAAIAGTLDANDKVQGDPVAAASAVVSELASGVRKARLAPAR